MATETIGNRNAFRRLNKFKWNKTLRVAINGYWEFDDEVMVHFMSSLVILLKCFRAV